MPLIVLLVAQPVTTFKNSHNTIGKRSNTNVLFIHKEIISGIVANNPPHINSNIKYNK